MVFRVWWVRFCIFKGSSELEGCLLCDYLVGLRKPEWFLNPLCASKGGTEEASLGGGGASCFVGVVLGWLVGCTRSKFGGLIWSCMTTIIVDLMGVV